MQQLTGLGLSDAQSAVAPINVIEGQTHQLATAQPVGCRQIEQGEVTSSDRFGTVDRSDERLNPRPRKGSRQPFSTIHPGSIDLQMQRSSQHPLRVPLFEISPNRRDNLLHTGTVVGPRRLSQEGFHLTEFKLPQSNWLAVKPEEPQECSEMDATARDRHLSRTSGRAQISAEALEFHLHRRGWRPVALRHQLARTQEPL